MQHDFILLDRSGSMAERNLWTEALAAVNGYVKKLAEDGVDTGVTLAAFDGNEGLAFDIVRDRIVPRTWKAVSNADCSPRGMTPLNDAVGRIVALAERGNYSRVSIVIMTDGHENASHELSVTQAKDLLDRCRARGWVVTFLGANFDNAAQGASYGNIAAHTHTVSSVNLAASGRMTAAKRATYGVTGRAASMDFNDDEKQALASNKPVGENQ